MSAALLKDLATRRFWSRVAVNGFAAVGALVLFLEVYNLVAPDWANAHGRLVALTIAITAILYGGWRAWPRPVEQEYTKPTAKIRVVVGNLFDQDTNLVIGMSTTFDTEVPHIIGTSSIQAQFLARVYNHELGALDGDLAIALTAHSPVGTIAKPGKKEQYAMGTVAIIRHQRKHYFCVAYSEMDENNQAHSSVDDVWRSLSNLWTSVRVHANGEPVAITVLGGGLSRLSSVLPALDAIRLTILSYVFASRQSKVCDRLDIVVRPEAAEKLDMAELQDFLRSLKES